MIARMGEPTGNTSSAILHSICVEVGKTHKVGLCGQGADELLGGYPRHLAERLYPLGSRAPALAGAAASGIYRDGAGSRLAQIFRTRDRIDRYVNIFAHVTPETADRLVPGGTGTTRELARQVIAEWATEESPEDPLNDLLRVDARVSLADDLLIVADLCSMYESVELRVPFLDLAFVDLTERMPSRYKIGALGNRKWLYRKAAAARLPAATSRRLFRSDNPLKRKRGFSPPRGSRSGADSRPHDEAGWATPFLEVDAFDGDAVTLEAASGDPARGRSVLTALSTWLEAQEIRPRTDGSRTR
jgi:asparagine synthase (glutamine-hydrolysing)